jgi:hypothetical protein
MEPILTAVGGLVLKSMPQLKPKNQLLAVPCEKSPKASNKKKFVQIILRPITNTKLGA